MNNNSIFSQDKRLTRNSWELEEMKQPFSFVKKGTKEFFVPELQIARQLADRVINRDINVPMTFTNGIHISGQIEEEDIFPFKKLFNVPSFEQFLIENKDLKIRANFLGKAFFYSTESISVDPKKDQTMHDVWHSYETQQFLKEECRQTTTTIHPSSKTNKRKHTTPSSADSNTSKVDKNSMASVVAFNITNVYKNKNKMTDTPWCYIDKCNENHFQLITKSETFSSVNEENNEVDVVNNNSSSSRSSSSDDEQRNKMMNNSSVENNIISYSEYHKNHFKMMIFLDSNNNIDHGLLSAHRQGQRYVSSFFQRGPSFTPIHNDELNLSGISYLSPSFNGGVCKYWIIGTDPNHQSIRAKLNTLKTSQSEKQNRKLDSGENENLYNHAIKLIDLCDSGDMLVIQQQPGQVISVPGTMVHAVYTVYDSEVNPKQCCFLSGISVADNIESAVTTFDKEDNNKSATSTKISRIAHLYKVNQNKVKEAIHHMKEKIKKTNSTRSANVDKRFKKTAHLMNNINMKRRDEEQEKKRRKRRKNDF